MIKFDFIPLEDVFDEVVSFIEQNREEVKKATDDFDFDFAAYRNAAEFGQMMLVSLRHDGKIVGFSLFHLSLNLRNKKVIEATNHGLIVLKPYRKKFGQRMLQEADKFLKRIGVSETIYINDRDSFGRLLERNGYKAKYKVWSVKYGQ